jgi:protocatechuate 4,5-dioxygenase alpha chain
MSGAGFIRAPERGYSPADRVHFPEVMLMLRPPRDIPGTTLFDGVQAMKGYALNRMCYSFNSAANREEFKRNEDAYCARYGLTAGQRDAVRRRDVLALLAAGGNVYYLAKLAGILGLDVQDLGAQQTGTTKEAFKARLVAAGG